MAKAYSWTAPLAAPTGLACSLAPGGSLPDGNTYYYTVMAVSHNADIRYAHTLQYTGPVCSEQSAGPTGGGRNTIDVSWNAVSGAAAYIVFRSTTSADYDASDSRFKRLSDGQTNYPTTTGTSFSDDGTYGMTTPSMQEIMPSGTTGPGNLDYTTTGRGSFSFTGGTALDPITLANIYRYFVLNVASYSNYIAWDGMHLALIGNWYTSSSTETHLLASNEMLTIIGDCYLDHTNASSNLQFGQQDTYSQPYAGCQINILGSRGHINILYDALTMYNSHVCNLCTVGSAGSDWMEGTTYILNPYYLKTDDWNEVDDFAVEEFSYYQNYASSTDVYLKGLRSTSISQTPVYGGETGELLYQWKAGLIQTIYNGVNDVRLDDFTLYASSYQYYMTGATAQSVQIIDGKHPNTPDANNVPRIRWSAGGGNGYAKGYVSLVIKFVDRQGNALSGVDVSITDTNGNAAVDYDGTAITHWSTNTDGYLLLEAATETAGGDDEVFTDSSKSWTNDEYQGRNFILTDGDQVMERVKVLTNDSDELTFCEAAARNYDIGDRGGIIPELKIYYHVNNGSSGVDQTTKTSYNPFTIYAVKAGMRPIRLPLEAYLPVRNMVIEMDYISITGDTEGH